MNSALGVIQRQLKSFLTDPEPSPEMAERVTSAPTHNMASERGLGCLDKMMRRAPVATGGFLSGKVRSKLNKCTLWLQGKPLHEQERLVNFAISQAKDDRVRRCVLEKSVEGEIGRRRKELAEERAMKNRSAVIRQVRKALKVRCASDLKCEEPLKDRVEHFIHHPESIIGTLFLHTTEDGSEFYGRGTVDRVLGFRRLRNRSSGSLFDLCVLFHRCYFRSCCIFMIIGLCNHENCCLLLK